MFRLGQFQDGAGLAAAGGGGFRQGGQIVPRLPRLGAALAQFGQPPGGIGPAVCPVAALGGDGGAAGGVPFAFGAQPGLGFQRRAFLAAGKG